MPTPCFYLNVTSRGYEAEIFLNGAPVVRCARAFPRIALPTVSEWVVQGENVLSARVELDTGAEEPSPSALAAGTGSGTPVPPPASEEPPLLRVSLCKGEIGELVDPGQENELVVLDWVPPTGGPDGATSAEERVTVDLAHPWGAWSWQSAPVVDFDADTRARNEMVQFLHDIHAGLERGHLDALLDASGPKFDELGPCYDTDPGDARGQLGTAWPEITKPAGWALAPLDEKDLDLRLCCGGRVVEPRTLTGEPILRQAVMLEGQRWMMPLFIARVDGRFTVVR